ncbi:MAG: SusE domain-containing protein [Bacteroidetes bacterium]|nr:SusE domain-containing protein [Bacteroidota bacterium]MCL6102509.1 SusE domain-containing protein [Bacteroidota bacterium]
MNKKIFIYLTFIGLIGILFSCKKDETKAILSDNPVAPTLVSVPDLTLKRANGTNVLQFVGTAVDPGFQASATYYLEACVKGTNFKDPLLIFSDKQDLSMKISVSDLNGIFLKKYPADQLTSVDLRIRSVLSVSSGTASFVYSSVTKSADATTYGLPRLDLIGSGITQKIESALGNGVYVNFVKLDATKSFTLKDPDSNTIYGGSNGVLSVNGSGIKSTANGWYRLTVDTKALTYKLESYMVGLVGDATPNGWSSPDQKMDYNASTGTWSITLNLVSGGFKFRLNDDWGWNLGGTTDNLTQGGANCSVTAGNYTITLTIINGTTGTYTIVKNN